MRDIIGISEREAAGIKDACQRYLDERQEAMDAIQLIKLYNKQKKSSQTSKESINKRPRVENEASK